MGDGATVAAGMRRRLCEDARAIVGHGAGIGTRCAVRETPLADLYDSAHTTVTLGSRRRAGPQK